MASRDSRARSWLTGCARRVIWLYYSQNEIRDHSGTGGGRGPPVPEGEPDGRRANGARRASAARAREGEQEPHQAPPGPLPAPVPAPRRRGSRLLRRRGRHGGGARHRRKIGGTGMARQVRKSGVKEVPLSEVKDDLSRYLREAP